MKVSSTFLGVVASSGVILSSVLTGLGTVKAVEKKQKFVEENEREPTKKELVKMALPHYISSFTVSATTIGCIMGMCCLNKRTQASLASAYAVLDQSYRKYREKIVELFGEEADETTRKEMSKDVKKETPVNIVKTSAEQLMFYDEISERYFFRTMLEVADAEYNFNRYLMLNGQAPLNLLYQLLGLETRDWANNIGWDLYIGEIEYGYQWVDFEHVLCEEPCDPDGPSYYLIHMPFPPHKLDYVD